MLEIPSAPPRLAPDALERAFFGLHPRPTLDLAAQHCDPPLLDGLRRAFVPLHIGLQQHLGGLWSTFVFVGRKGCPAPS